MNVCIYEKEQCVSECVRAMLCMPLLGACCEAVIKTMV